MPDPAPPLLPHGAGEVVLPDVDHPLPIKLLLIAILAWIFFGPIFTYRAVRRGRPVRGVTVYVAGLLAGIAVILAVEWGWPNPETPLHRFAVLWRHLGSWFFYIGCGLAAIAVGLGYAVGHWRKAPK